MGSHKGAGIDGYRIANPEARRRQICAGRSAAKTLQPTENLSGFLRPDPSRCGSMRRWKQLGFRAIVVGMYALKSQLRRLKKLLCRGGATPEDAEDLVQEAMLRLHAYTNAGRDVRHPQAFVTRTAMNLAVDVHRHSRSGLYERESVEELNLVDLSPAPDEILAAEQRLLRMREALDRVGLRTREIFFMHRLQGFSHAEIASKLGVSKSAVEKHIASAVTVLAMQRQRE